MHCTIPQAAPLHLDSALACEPLSQSLQAPAVFVCWPESQGERRAALSHSSTED